jgi:hypothetical protein
VSANLEMDQDPLSQGWTVLQGSGGGSHSVANGILTINSPSFYELHAPESVLDGLSNSQGWRIDARLRLNSGTSPLSLRFWVNDGTELNYIDIGPNGLRLYGGGNNPDYQFSYPIGNTFHTYRTEVIGKSITMYVDEQLVFNRGADGGDRRDGYGVLRGRKRLVPDGLGVGLLPDHLAAAGAGDGGFRCSANDRAVGPAAPVSWAPVSLGPVTLREVRSRWDARRGGEGSSE